MNLEEVVEAVDAAVFAKSERHLSLVETVVLRGAWQGHTYEQTAKTCQYSLTYIKQAAGPKLWKLLSEVFGEEVSKTNFRAALERRFRLPAEQVHTPLFSSSRPEIEATTLESPRHEVESVSTGQRQDWDEAPDVSVFYGRTQELATLEQWIVKDRCRLVSLVGMGGIGKTTLSIRCARQIQDEFESVVWRSLRHAPPLQEILADLIQSLSQQQATYLPVDLDDRVSRLIDYLHRHRCLLILDNMETILRRGELAGYYRQEHQGYREFLRRVIETPHQSCLVLTSLEKPREIAALAGKTLPVRSLQLAGLDEAAQGIFREKNLSESGKWRELIQLYRGNPLALKIVATTIQELFGGKINEFLKHNSIVFGDINDLLEEQFERLSTLEQEVLSWLAIAGKPVSLPMLRTNMLAPVPQSELIEALESLGRRSMIERGGAGSEGFFTLQPVVMEYVTSSLIKQVCEEIQQMCKTQKIQQIELLRNYALTKSQADKDFKGQRSQQILVPIKDRLLTIFRDERLIKEQLTQILTLLQGNSPLAIGYAPENIQNLLLELEADPNLQQHELLH